METGAPDYNELNDSTTKTYDTSGFYNAKRGSLTGKICTSNTEFCNDMVVRTTSWTVYVNANDSFGSKWFRPTIYLKSNVKIISGTGTSSDPYKLEI